MQAKDLIVLGSSRLLGKIYCGDIDISGTASFSGKITTNQLVVSSTTDISGTSTPGTAPFVVGNISGTHIEIDPDEIIAKNNASTSHLYLNYNGGNVYLSGSTVYASGSTMYGTTFSGTTGNITNVNSNTITNQTSLTNKGNIYNINGRIETDQIRSNIWDIVSTQNLGGDFFVAPTIMITDGSTVTITSVSGNTLVGTIKDTTNITSNSFGGHTWSSASKIKITGKLTSGSNNYILGVCDGTLTANMNTTANTINFSVTCNATTKPPTGTYTITDGTVMMYSVGSSNKVGIYMTCYGTDKYTYIDIYNGSNGNKPVARLGKLDNLGTTHGVTVNGENPAGYGLFTSNGYYEGKIVANGGKIGGYTIGTANLTKGTTQNADGSFWLTPDGQSTNMSTLNNGALTWALTVGQKFGVTTNGQVYATGGKIGGWNIDATGLRAYGDQNGASTATNALYYVYIASAPGTNGGSYAIGLRTRTTAERTAGSPAIGSATVKFGVSHSGYMIATDAHITGEIKATSGVIGNNASNKITIGTNTRYASIYSGSHSALTSTVDGFYIGADGLSIGSKFSVTNAGKLTASDITINSGSIASTVTIGGKNQSEYLNSNIEVGGRNLFGYGSQCESLEGFTLSGAWDITTEDGYKCAHASGALQTTKYFYSKIPFKPQPNETVTISGYVKIKNIVYGTTNPMCEFYLGGQTIDGAWRHQTIDAVYVDGIKATSASSGKFTSYISDTNWHHIAFVRTWHNYSFTVNLPPHVYFRDATGDLYVRDLKYERGNKATDWTPAPEDIDVHKYITDIDSNNGITIKPLNTSGNNYLQINSTAIEFYRGAGTNSAAVSVMSLTDTTFRIGKSDSQRVEVISSGVDIYSSDNKKRVNLNSSGVTIGQSSGTSRINITDSAMTVYNASGTATSTFGNTILLGSNGASITLGSTSGTNANTVISTTGIQMKKGSNAYVDLNSSGTLTLGNTSSGHTILDGNGMTIKNNTTTLATFGSDVQIGASNTGHVNIASTGMDIYGSNGTVTLTHFGYEPVNSEPTSDGTSVSNNPYYTIGRRYDFTSTPNYSSTKAYSIGDIVIYENDHYVCIKDMATAESWTRSHWLELFSTKIGSYSVTEGFDNIATAHGDHAEGRRTVAQGAYSHAEGYYTIAGSESDNVALGAHSEGIHTVASSSSSHAEGMYTSASGLGSHAEGECTEATGGHAHAQNNGTIARYSQTAIGEYNVAQGSNYGRSSGDLAFIIGNGVSNSARSNALTVDWQGNVKASSFYDTINLSLGSYNASGFLTNAGGTIHFSIPTGRVFPSGTTVSSISFNCVARVANANGTGYYCIKSSSNGTSAASINSLGGSSFYNAGNVAKSISNNMWTISLNGGTNITIAMGSGDDLFSGTSTIRGYTNNQPVALMLTNISVLLSLS